MLRLASGEEVVDRYQSHLHADVARLLPEALGKIDPAGRKFLVEEVDFGRLIGGTTCAATGPDDEVLFAKRPKRFGHSRFVKNRTAEPCSSIVVILKKAEDFDETYILITAFIGHRPEPEPWDRNATANSRAFWDSHALVWGSEPTVPGTETDKCPW
ncbi:MAG: hypothetical protein WCT37_02980 [Patescibacteria group bacterium]|jgi:hypothetical protein